MRMIRTGIVVGVVTCALMNQWGCSSAAGPPARTLGWGMTADIPKSDPYIAAELARRHGLGFDFVSYDSDNFLENANSWAYISELANDNIGWYAEGQSVLASDYRTKGDFVLTGDECFGGGSFVRSEEEVRSEGVVES